MHTTSGRIPIQNSPLSTSKMMGTEGSFLAQKFEVPKRLEFSKLFPIFAP